MRIKKELVRLLSNDNMLHKFTNAQYNANSCYLHVQMCTPAIY